MADYFEEIKAFVNKGIDAYVDIEQAKHTEFTQPAHVTSNDGRAYVTGAASGPVVAANGGVPWVMIGLGGVAVVAFLLLRK